MVGCRFILGIFLLPVFASWRRILVPGGAAAVSQLNRHGRNNFHPDQQQVIQPVPNVYRTRSRTPRVDVYQPMVQKGELVQHGEGEEGVNAVDVEYVMEDYWVFWLRTMVFASQKIKIDELEAKLKDHDVLQSMHEDLLSSHEKLTEAVVKYRDENQELRGQNDLILEKLRLAESDRDLALRRLEGSESLREYYHHEHTNQAVQLGENNDRISDLKSKLEDAEVAIADKLELAIQADTHRINQLHDFKDAIGADSLDVISEAKKLKQKAEKRKEKLRKAREEVEKLTIEKDGLAIDKESLEVDIENLKIDLEEAEEQRLKIEELKSEAEEALNKAKKDLEEKEAAFAQCNESNEATCQILAATLEELKKKVEQKTEDLEQANVNFRFAVEKFQSLDHDYHSKTQELDTMKTEMSRLQQDKMEAAFALGIHGEEVVEKLQFTDLVEIIKRQKGSLEEAIEDKAELKKLSGALLAKLEAVTDKLNTEWKDVLTDCIDDLLDELRAEQESNKEARMCLSSAVEASKVLRGAAMDLDESHLEVCLERDQLASNQIVLIQKLRDTSEELELALLDHNRTLCDQQIAMCTEVTLKTSLARERARVKSLESVLEDEKTANKRLYEKTLDQKATIKSLSEKKQELEEKMARSFKEIQENKEVSEKVQATLCDIKSQFEIRTKEHAELQNQITTLTSEYKANKAALEECEQAISALKSEIAGLVESKANLISVLGKVFGVELSEEDAVEKLAEVRESQSNDMSKLHQDLLGAVEAVETLKEKLADEADKLRHEMKERINDNEIYKVNLALYAFNMANLSQYIGLLEKNNKGLDWNVRNRIATIKKTQEKLDEAEKKLKGLSDELDEVLCKYLDAETNYELAMEALSELTAQQEEDRLVAHALISSLHFKLLKKKSKIAAERKEASGIVQSYEEAIKELHEKIKADMAERMRLESSLRDERHVRELGKLDIEELKAKVNDLEEKLASLEKDKAALEEENKQLDSLQIEYFESVEAVETLKEKLAEEADKLRHEMQERTNDNEIYQVNLALYAFNMANLSQYIELLEKNNKGLDWNVRNRIATIKKTQEKLDKAEEKQKDLSDELDEMMFKYLDAETNYELAMESLAQSQKDFQETLDALSIAQNKVMDLLNVRSSLIKERDDAVEHGIQKDLVHLDLTARLSEIGKKLLKKKTKLVSERREAAGLAQSYEQTITELQRKVQAELAEKRRLAMDLLNEKHVRKDTELDIETLKGKVRQLEDKIVKLSTEKDKLEDENIKLSVEKDMLDDEKNKLAAEKDKLADEKNKLLQKSAIPAPVIYRYQTCDDCECDNLVVPRLADSCSSAEIAELVEARAKTLVKADLEQCKNVKVANLAFFGSGLACLGAAGGLVGYWFIKLKPLIAMAAVAA